MKLQKINFFILVIIIIFLSACSDHIGYNCDESKKEIWALIKSKNYCNTDSDCKINFEPCPFGCGFLVNKDADLSDMKNEIKIYRKKCLSCKDDCRLLPDQENIKCINSKCAVKINEETINKPSKREIKECLSKIIDTGLSHIDFCYQDCCYMEGKAKKECEDECYSMD
ncbi:hypothetical protein K8R66_05160 [bacterium]|nr:hypothetical protein [bacterium]